jgi:phosphoribosyl-ATP pyrophosphohydrolase/phosphoribosyl-AMP cyclohydrolase
VKPEGQLVIKELIPVGQQRKQINYGFISALEDTIQVRRENADSEKRVMCSFI